LTSTVTSDGPPDKTSGETVDGLSGQAAGETADTARAGEPAMRSTLIGAELLNWSDLRPVDGRPATGGSVAAALLGAVLTEGDSVLVAGPHSLDLLEQVADRAASVDVLVRSAPDAEEIAERLADRPVRVFCGALDRFTPGHGEQSGEQSYDVVVALDGLPRLVGTDSRALTWTEALSALRERLAPAGRLLLAAGNPFGIERLLEADVTATLPRDDAWPRELGGSLEAPAGLQAVRTAVQSVGLDISTAYAVYPELTDAKVAFADATGPLAGTVIARAVAARFTGPTLTDPYRTAQDAVAAGLGNQLAAGWFLVTGAASLPEVLPADALPEGPGQLLEETLLAALRLDDHVALRRAVTGYVDWLRDQDAATAASAALDNLLSDGTSYRVFDKAWVPAASSGGSDEGPGDALVVRQLARFVRRSLEAGVRQPWTVGSSPRELRPRRAARGALTGDAELGQTVADSDQAVRPQGSAEQLVTIARLSHELSEANAQVVWFDDQLQKVRRSRPYRIGLAVMNPARVVYRRLHPGIR
jgi:hypothetical protein